MNEVPPLDGEALLKALVEGEVSFIIIGGLALGAHGFQRATNDIDIVPEPTRDNFRRLLDALDALDYRVLGLEEFDPDEIDLPGVETLEAGGSWVLVTRFGRLDILQYVDPGLDYSLLAREAIDADVLGMKVRLCSYDHLVAMKEHAGRAQDAVDLQRLRAIRGEAENG